MNLEFKPNKLRIFVPSIIGYTISFFILFAILINTSFLTSFIEISFDGGLLQNIIKYLIYGIIGFLIFLNIMAVVGFSAEALTTIYSMKGNYVTRVKTQIDEIREDVPMKQITNIEYTISWFWDKIFGTGTVAVYTSGSSGADLNVSSINSVEEIYEKIRTESKRVQGKPVEDGELLKTVKPNVAIATLFALWRVIPVFLIMIIGGLYTLSLPYGVIYSSILIGFPVATLYFTIMGYKRKKYDFYTDRLDYFDGFLTLRRKTIPLERITNVDLQNSLFERLFGMSNISIETAGSQGPELTISFVSDGEVIIEELKEVLKKYGRN